MLTRKFHGPRRFVSCEDPAVSDGYEEYVKNSYDYDKLDIDPAQTPTVFGIEPLITTLANAVDDLPMGRTRDVQIVRGGLVSVTGLTLEKDDGSKRECPKVERSRVGNLGEMLTEAWFEETSLQGWLLAEIAQAIWRITEPDPLS